MIKVQNSVASREPIPAFLHGLAPESLADLSWTDPELGVSDAAWWPEVDQSPGLAQHQSYGAEALTIDTENKVVVVVREVIDWTQEQIDAHEEAQRKARTPAAVTMRQGRLALLSAGLLSQVDSIIAALPAEQRAVAKVEWEYAQEIRRDSALLVSLTPALGVTDAQMDELFIQAATL